MRKSTLDELAECRDNLKQSKEINKKLKKIQTEYSLYVQIMKETFSRQHERVLLTLQMNKNKSNKK